jgi:hypothetical protein
MFLSIARQGIHINRTEEKQSRFIARQGIHFFSMDMVREDRRYVFFYGYGFPDGK